MCTIYMYMNIVEMLFQVEMLSDLYAGFGPASRAASEHMNIYMVKLSQWAGLILIVAPNE